MSRALAAIVSGALIAAFAFYSSLLVGDRNAWLIAVIIGLGTGAALLSVGVLIWFGVTARRFRAIGFVVGLWASFATVSFAFALVPIALLAVPSLRTFEHKRDRLVSGRAGLV